jgi:hypothetical protein
VSDDLKRAAYCRQKLEDIKSHIHDIIVELTNEDGRLKMFESMLMGRVEAINDCVAGSIERVRFYEDFRRKKDAIPDNEKPDSKKQ